MIDSAFLQKTQVPVTIKEHLTKKIGMGSQSACIDLKSLTLDLEDTLASA